MKRYRHVNEAVIGRAHGGPVERAQQIIGGLGGRLALVVGAEVVFAILVDLVTGAPPAFVTTAAFGIVLAVGLAWQARSSPV